MLPCSKWTPSHHFRSMLQKWWDAKREVHFEHRPTFHPQAPKLNSNQTSSLLVCNLISRRWVLLHYQSGERSRHIEWDAESQMRASCWLCLSFFGFSRASTWIIVMKWMLCHCRNVNVCPWRLHQPALDTTMASMQMELQVETTTLWSCELLKRTAVTWIFQLAFFAASGATFLCNK